MRFPKLPYYVMGIDVDERNVPTYVIVNRTTRNLVDGPAPLYEIPWWFIVFSWVGQAEIVVEKNGPSADLVAAMRNLYSRP